MGGFSTINYMLYVRGNAKDYDGWADTGNSGWSYEEVLSYFLKSENNRDPQVINLIRIHIIIYHKIKLYTMYIYYHYYYYFNYNQNEFYSLNKA